MSDSDAAVNVLNITLAVSHVATALCYVALLATTPRRLHVPWRERLFSWMSRSSIGLLLITLNALFSLLSCALFCERPAAGRGAADLAVAAEWRCSRSSCSITC